MTAPNVLPFPARSSVAHDLTGRAVIVSLTVRRWEAKKTDNSVNHEVAVRHGSDAEMGEFKKLLIARRHMEKGRKLADAIGAEHRRRTAPWRDGGTRVLASGGILDYSTAMSKLIDEYHAWASDELVPNYEAFKREAKVALGGDVAQGGLYAESEYPHVSRLKGLFTARYLFEPFATEDDFRVQLSAGEIRRLRAEYAAEVASTQQAAMKDTFQRLHEVVSHMAERLNSYDPSGKKVVGVFRDTLVDNVRDVVEVLPSLNITGDPDLDRLYKTAKDKLLAHDAQTLRESLGARQTTAVAAEQVVSQINKKMADFFA